MVHTANFWQIGGILLLLCTFTAWVTAAAEPAATAASFGSLRGRKEDEIPRIGGGGSPLIVPTGIVSLMHFIYSRIPIISKGTDSRVGIGFRFGPHADLQFLVELGPQQHTQSLGDPQNPAPCCGNEEPGIQDFSNSLAVYRPVARSPAIRSPGARNSVLGDVNLDGRKARVAAADWLGRWQEGFSGRAPRSHQQKTENIGSTKKAGTSTPLLTALHRFRDLWVAGRKGAA